jgi:lipopolysaccharide/colanic/teichoic acid biosynthesis glycosyltransferase
VATYPVLGLPADIEGILDRLEVHGVSVRQIVVAAPFRTLPPEARVALSHVVSSRGITLQLLHETLGLEAGVEKTGEAEALSQNIPPQPTFEITPSEQQLLSKRLFWKVKRALDFLGALGILALLSPFLLLLALAVAFSIGRPVVFWQRRPGLGGRAFHLYKFRTMRPAHAPDGRRLSDGERLSRMGSFMRATRLDELPQFFNILRGDMSFVGPRPLLWQDQPQSFEARLLVRPGLTGWAQVVGGRDIPSHDKAALDVWYVRHADFFLDLNIAARTIPIVLFGERISASLIENAWRDLASCGIVKKAVVD